MSNLFRAHRKIKAVIAVAAIGVLGALPAMAQGTGGPDLGLGYATAIGLTTADIRTTISRIISYFLGFLGIIAVGIMLYAGFLWMTAGGNEEKISQAKRWMINGTIGLVIIMSAFAITQFVFRAIQEGSQGTGPGGCPPGQVCGGGGGLGGGGLGTFKITGITPAGPGPGDKGWPKNYAIQTFFNAPLAVPAAPSTIPTTWVTVTKCNPRVDGTGKAQPFDNAACTTPIDGDRSIAGNALIFKANPVPPGQFDGEFWYLVRLQGGAVKDQNGRLLSCPFTPPGPTGDISSPQAEADLCDRAVAINDLVDITPPTVAVDAPASPPAYCGADLAPVHAVANDDFLVASVGFLLDGGTDHLVDVNGDPLSNSVNAGLVNPFTSDTVNVDIGTMSPGPHQITAIAQDGVPQSSAPSGSSFTVNPPHCCNATKDDAEGETGVDCGGACGACNGSTCTTDADCSSGFCDPKTGTCQEKPIIESIDVPGSTPMAGGPGTLITINGNYFGDSAGTIVFLGGPGDTDDVVANPCNPAAWTDKSIVVAVPSNAVSGPIRVNAAYGGSDQTDDSPDPQRGPNLGAFTVNSDVSPGICYLSPTQGTTGSQFDINGSGFGATIASSTVSMGSYPVTVANSGWTDTKVTGIVPPAPEKSYPVTVTVGGKTTNAVDFLVSTGGQSGQPRVTGVIPESGPIGSYVTVQGLNFGNLKGTVYFKFKGAGTHCIGGTKNGAACTSDADCTGGGTCSGDVALAEDPVCSDNWHDNYIIVKVPKQYQGGLGLQVSAPPGVGHGIQVVTASPARTSNDDVMFGVTNEPPRPGVCKIDPDNGRPGKGVQVYGEGFGTVDPASAGPASAPRYSVEFFKNKTLRCVVSGAPCATIGKLCSPSSDGVCAPSSVTAPTYGSWGDSHIGTVVAGDYLTRSTWPVTGPVYVVANNQLSSNAVPFTVGDCNDAGATCPAGTECCGNGSCQGAPNFCAPPARVSAYGWIFSTNVLPELPVVVENPICRHDPLPEILQSPSPYKDSSDACQNAEARVQFSTEMQMDYGSLNANVELMDCGNGDAPACASGSVVSGLQFDPRDCDPLASDHCKVLSFIPPDGHYNGNPYFKPGYWYQVTLKSQPGSGTGLKEPGANGLYLDGDYDRQQGGNYVYTFRVSKADAVCELSSVFVDPSSKTIDQDTDPVSFQSLPTGANCNALQCGPALYTIAWFANSTFLDLSAPAPAPPPKSNFCKKPVLAKLETPTTPLTSQMTPLGTSAMKSGESEVTVKFAEPHVVEVSPIEGCNAACINAAIYARFNVPMDLTSLTASGNIELYRCRNSSCTAPFLPVSPTVRGLSAPADYFVNGTPIYKHFEFKGSGSSANLMPSTFYTVRIKGGPNGVKSRSGVPLAGLNDGDYYQWKFRTKDDTTVCSVNKATINPSESTLFYVGQRRDLTLSAFGSPDECNKSGQPLLADGYSWDWGFAAPNPVLGGYIDGFAATPISRSPVATVVNTQATPKIGCTSSCLLSGSQNVLPQCGDGVTDPQYEECDPAGALCSSSCLYIGTKAVADGGTCGNGTVDASETCDKSLRCVGGANEGKTCSTNADCSGGTCDSVFPNGCKVPGTHVDGFDDTRGCINTGSSTTNGKSKCGDGFIGDGESCDDGNAANGDGCSADCLLEGSLPSCSGAPQGQACISVCGNGIVEPGEDKDCEDAALGPSVAARGCNPQTCLKKGSPTCGSPSDPNCCGNGVVEHGVGFGEDPECEQPGAQEYCTRNCLLKGSSPFYSQPSFCGDGFTGMGEKAECKQSPDAFVDPYQVTVADPSAADGFDAKSAAGSTSTVVATTAGVPSGNEGKAKVALSCTCKTKGSAQDSFCESFASLSPPLACGDNGCCAQRPSVTAVKPSIGSNDICRNPLITVSFDQLMEHGSVEQGIIVAFQQASPTCPSGTSKVLMADAGGLSAPSHESFWARVWNAVKSFIRVYVVKPVFGSATLPPNYAATFCAVPAQVNVIDEGEPVPTASTAYVSIRQALPASTPIAVHVLPTVKSKNGVTLGKVGFCDGGPNSGLACKTDSDCASFSCKADFGYKSYFGTDDQICTISSVSVKPPYVLFNSVNQPKESLVAVASASDGQAIVSIPGTYEWSWLWTPLPSDASAVVEPDLILGKETFTAGVRVRGSDKAKDGGFTPKNGENVAEASAIVHGKKCFGGTHSGLVCTTDGDCGGGTCGDAGTQTYSGTSRVTVFLCDNPWPERKVCDASNTVKLPWDAANADSCVQNARYWYPFYDASTNFEFYYCRDGKGTGDVAPLLPALRETPVIIQPGRDILKEYLFTYDTTQPLPDPNGASWVNDAIGLRISTNPQHFGIAQWFKSKGFTGGAQATKVDGYDALIDGRTVYVNAAAMSPIGGGKNNLYTNVNILSKTDGASPETDNIFTQVLSLINFNRNKALQDFGICRVGPGLKAMRCNSDQDCHVNASGVPAAGLNDDTCDIPTGLCVDKSNAVDDLAGVGIGCSYDLQCQVGADGSVVLDGTGHPARASYVCDAAKQKLTRDVRRWSDFQSMRKLITDKLSGGSIPSLAAGTYLVTLSNSTWPSWQDTLTKGVLAGGQSAPSDTGLPQDPVNQHGWCLDTTGDAGHYDAKTCWNDTARAYRCPGKSHIYQYQYFQTGVGQNFRLDTDLETPDDLVKTWAGKTCIELGMGDCTGDCVWENGSCNYKVGKFDIGGVNPVSPLCTDTKMGGSSVCGDGIVGPGEICEPGQEKADACTDGLGRHGSQKKVCLFQAGNVNNCKAWTDPTPVDTCHTGSCGDGVVQLPEVCDDGSLNGTYGHCDKTCDGKGFFCGDGKRSPNEQCDCKDLNGQYGFNGILAPRATYGLSLGTCSAGHCTGDGSVGCVSNADCSLQVCGATATNKATCAWDCSGPGPRCGDGIVQAGEICDGNAQDFKGYCDDSVQTGCNTSADCPTGHTCGNFCPTAEQHRHRSCVANDPASSGDDTIACNWGAWTCTAPGYCGNGVKETGEECDDGNTNNGDDCVIDPAKGIYCKKAVCGDGYVDGGAGEQCDEGKNNGRACKPGYGLNCTYCTAQCKTAVISGGFCGDNVLQSIATDPVGPEECEGTVGLEGGGWICMSTRPEDQSFGKRTGDAICSTKSCLRSCSVPESAVCHQSSGPNHDSENCPGSLNAANATLCGADKTAAGGKPIYDVCDPDEDNDGVPKSLDCDDFDPDVHPAYHLDYAMKDGSPANIDIKAPAMLCNHKDNACNGLIDQSYIIDGKVTNAKTGDPLPGAAFDMYCGTKLVFSGESSNQGCPGGASCGTFTVTAVDDGTCNGYFTVVPKSNAVACGDPEDAVTIPISSLAKCTHGTVNVLITTPTPGTADNPGIASVFLTWNDTSPIAAGSTPDPDDLDLHVRSSAGQHLYYSGTTAIPEFGWDHDNISNAAEPADRIETVSITNYFSAHKYDFYIHNYTNRNTANTTSWGDRPHVRVRFVTKANPPQYCDFKTWKIDPDTSHGGRYWNVFTVQDGNIISGGAGDGGPGDGLTDTEPANPAP